MLQRKYTSLTALIERKWLYQKLLPRIFRQHDTVRFSERLCFCKLLSPGQSETPRCIARWVILLVSWVDFLCILIVNLLFLRFSRFWNLSISSGSFTCYGLWCGLWSNACFRRKPSVWNPSRIHNPNRTDCPVLQPSQRIRRRNSRTSCTPLTLPPHTRFVSLHPTHPLFVPIPMEH